MKYGKFLEEGGTIGKKKKNCRSLVIRSGLDQTATKERESVSAIRRSYAEKNFRKHICPKNQTC